MQIKLQFSSLVSPLLLVTHAFLGWKCDDEVEFSVVRGAKAGQQMTASPDHLVRAVQCRTKLITTCIK